MPRPLSSSASPAVAFVLLAFLAPAALIIALGVDAGPQFADQAEYHLPTIQQFARQWPSPDFSSPRAAMTPGYHLLMAGLFRATDGSVRALQAATAIFTAGLLATLAGAVARRIPTADAILLCLPLAWSPYLLTSGVYVVPHNLSWWAVLGVLLVALRPRTDARLYVGGGLLLLAAVATRQIHLWLAAPLLMAAWLGDGRTASGRPRRLLLMFVAMLPAVALLGWFVYLWGGLTPRTQEWARPADGANLAAVAMMLAVFGVMGFFFLGYRSRSATKRSAAAASLVAGLLALVPVSTFDKSAGRWTGLWNLAQRAPTIADRSPLVVMLAALGGAVIGELLAGLRCRARWVTAAALLGFFAAHATVNQAWQRYYEPFVLMVLALAAADALTRAAAAGRPWPRRALLAALAIAQAALTALSLR